MAGILSLLILFLHEIFLKMTLVRGKPFYFQLLSHLLHENNEYTGEKNSGAIMFNLFKKKEEKPVQQQPIKRTLRDMLLGDLTPAEWLGNREGMPWSLFVEGHDQVMLKGDIKGAIKTYKKIAETPGLESRHYLQAWHFLRKLGTTPPADIARNVYGVVVDVVLESGQETVAAYADHHARYINYTGGGVIWEAPDASLNEKIDTLLRVCEPPARQLKPLDKHPLAPSALNAVQICILTPSGIHHGLGTFEGWSKDAMGGPILVAATDLMKSLVDKNISK
jgi:hypothetical protein